MDNARNNWDAAQAARLYGTVILVGITYTGPAPRGRSTSSEP
jgi:hypothetical protein